MEKDWENRSFDHEVVEYDEQIHAVLSANQTDDELYLALNEFHPYDLAHALLALEVNQQISYARRLPTHFVAAIFEHFSSEEQIAFLEQIDPLYAVQIIDRMETDDALDLLRYLRDEEMDIDYINLLSPKKKAELKKYWSYEEQQIGSVMSNSFIEISRNETVKDAMKKVTSLAADTDYISILYVLEKHQLVGYLKLKNLIIARASQTIDEIMEDRIISAKDTDDKESAAQILAEYGLSSIPILNQDNHLVGIVTHDDLIDVIAEAKSEDYRKFAAVVAEDRELKTNTVFDSVKNRFPWLAILLGLSLVTSFILGLFEGQLSSSAGAMALAASLAIYLPLILDMSGNTGTQSLAVMIRYLSTKKSQVTRAEIRRHLLREFGTGVVQGFLIAMAVFAIIFGSNWLTKGNTSSLSFITALVTALSIFVALIVSTLNGALIPMLMSKFSIDPAVASGPFITTVSDIITLTLYYSISLSLLLPFYVS